MLKTLLQNISNLFKVNPHKEAIRLLDKNDGYYEEALIDVLNLIDPRQFGNTYKPSIAQLKMIWCHDTNIMAFTTRLIRAYDMMTRTDSMTIDRSLIDVVRKNGDFDTFLCVDDNGLYHPAILTIQRFVDRAVIFIEHMKLCRTEDYGPGAVNYRYATPLVQDVKEIALAILELQE